MKDLPQKEEVYDEYEEQCVNIVDNYDLYLPMLTYCYDVDKPIAIKTYEGDYSNLIHQLGYREAYLLLADTLCVSI